MAGNQLYTIQSASLLGLIIAPKKMTLIAAGLVAATTI